MQEKRVRRNVRVLEDRDEKGQVTPVCVYYQNKRYMVERVLDVQKRAATKSGGFGLRYTVRLSNEEDGIHGKTTHLFFEADAQPAVWFVEEKQRHACGDINP